MKVLFFGRAEDSYSINCYKYLLKIGYMVDVVWSSSRNDVLPEKLDQNNYDYIFCFRSYFILPKELIDSVKFFCINFHPGSPKYPGTGGINFCLYKDDTDYGVTAHIMNEKIDNGEILAVQNILVSKDDNLESLLHKTHESLLELFISFSKEIFFNGTTFIEESIAKNQNIKWSKEKKSAKDLDKYQFIEIGVDEKEISKRIRSFHCTKYPLKLRYMGHEFIYKS